MKTLHFKWTVSRAADSYGYNVCTLFVDGHKVSRCNGGGYDMRGTCLGDYVARAYSDRLKALDGARFYGLTFHDPDFDPGKAPVEGPGMFGSPATGRTVEEREKAGESLGLERYQAFYRASSKHATKRHTVPLIDGACGFSSVERIMEAIHLRLERVRTKESKSEDVYVLIDEAPAPLAPAPR